MTARIAIQGIGVVGGFGSGIASLNRAVTEGITKAEEVIVPGPSGPLACPVLVADTEPLDQFVSRRASRRIDHCSKMAILGGFLALEDAGISKIVPERTAVVVATGYGTTRSTFAFLDSAIEDGDQCASPTHFANSVHNAPAAHVAMLLDAQGPALTVSQFGMSVPSALLAVRQCLMEKRVDTVLFGAVDEYSTVLGYSWQRFFGDDFGGAPMRPLELDIQSAIAGEGAAFFVLTRGDGDVPRYGFIDDVQVGTLNPQGLELPDDAVLFLGADGHKACAGNYANHVPPQAKLAAYSPTYGSHPSGPAFDMAIAALAMEAGRIPASPNCPTTCCFERVLRTGESLGAQSIACVKLGSGTDCSFGVIHLCLR